MIRVTRKRMVVLEMEASYYHMLQDVLGQASRVRSRVYPVLNETARMFLNQLTEQPRESDITIVGPTPD